MGREGVDVDPKLRGILLTQLSEEGTAKMAMYFQRKLTGGQYTLEQVRGALENMVLSGEVVSRQGAMETIYELKR